MSSGLTCSCCRTDLVSGVLKRKIAVVYADASQTDLELVGEVCFPNLHFDVTAVEFGSVLNDTTTRQLVVMSNTSKVDAAFHWQFADSEATDGETRAGMSIEAGALLPACMEG
jgi:hypothetical protein